MSQDKKQQKPAEPTKSRDDEAREVSQEYADQQRRFIEKLRKKDGHSGDH